MLLTFVACSPNPEEEEGQKKQDVVADELIYENLKYAVNDEGYYSITGYIPNGTEAVTLNIPAIIDGREVTAIADEAFKASKYISSVTFSADAETGEIYLNKIGEAAFYDCDALTEITLPATVTTIGASAFRECDKLAKVTFAEGTALETIGNGAFWACKALSDIALPATLKTIETAAFWDCDALVEVVLPESVTTLGDAVYAGCDALTKLTVPASVTTIGSDVLANCPNAKVDTPADSAFAKYMERYAYTFTEPAEGNA
jgi:hypothetical protein